ncbi:MAG: Ig-like domain-containing protein [Myxococcota bacterium]
MLIAACQQTELAKVSQAPVVSIENPVSGSTFDEGVEIPMSGRVIDEDFADQLDSLSAVWAVDEGRVCEDAVVDANGYTLCDYSFEDGEHTITLTVTNPEGLSASATSDVVVTPVNHTPTCEITNPQTGYFAAEGDTVLFEGVAADEDIAANQLTATWTSDKDGDLGTSTPDSGGEFFLATSTLSQNTHAVTLTVADDQGALCTDAILVSVGNLPDVTLESPLNGETYNEGDTVTFTATVSDVEDRPTDLTLSWESDLDGVFSVQGANSSGEATFTYDGLSRGTHTLSVTATDTDGFSAVDRATIYVNGLPDAPEVEITPDPSPSSDSITATITSSSSDPDGDSVTYRYEWYKDGVVTAYATSSITAANHAKGETWEVRVYPSDGYGEGTFGTDSTIIQNGAPSATSVTIDPTTAYTDSTLTAVVTGWSDPDGDTEAYRYAWSLNGSVISGAEDPTLAGTFFVKGDSVTVTVTPWDGTDTGTALTSGSRLIENSPPTAPVVAIDPELPEDDDNLECLILTDSTDADGDSISYTYSWKKNGVRSAITSSTVPRASTSNNETWECSVTPSDGTVSGTAGTDSVYVDDYTAPDPPVLTSLTPYRNEDTAVITGTTDASLDVTLYIVNSSGTTTSTTTANGAGAFTFSLTGLTRGESYSFYATAEDSEGNVSGASNTVTTEVCDPIDDYEDSLGYGDDCTDPILDWSVLSDAGSTTLTVTGNLPDSGDEDWYLVQTSDTVTGNVNYYRFHVEMTHGSSEYAFVVYEGGCSSSYLECSSGSSTDPEGSGYTEYEVFAEDQGEGSHSVPSDTRACGTGSSYNLCDDLSSDYYIHVIRKTSTYSCEYYELEITNGVW